MTLSLGPDFDNWLTDQDRWYGPSEDDYINWNEANEYQDEYPEEV